MTINSRVALFQQQTACSLSVNDAGQSDDAPYGFRDNGRVAWEAMGHYSTELHTTRVQEIIKARKKRAPFFIYLAYQNAHGPFEAKQR